MKRLVYSDVRGPDEKSRRVRTLLEDLTRGYPEPETLQLRQRIDDQIRQRERITARIIEDETKLRASCAHPVFALEFNEHEYGGAGGRRERFEFVACGMCGCTLYRGAAFI